MVKDLKKVLMTGVSYMLPLIVVAGFTIAIGGALQSYFKVEAAIVKQLVSFGWVVMGFIPPVFGAYVAFAIADKPAIIPGFIGGYIANNPVADTGAVASGFLGALVAGLIVGVLINQLKRVKFPETLLSLKSMLFIPLVASWLIYLLMGYPVGIALGYVYDAIVQGLVNLSENPTLAFILGAIMSGMIAVDMGGPLGKIAITTVFAVWAIPDVGFMVNAAVFPGIMVPPIAVGIAALIAPDKFTKTEKGSASTAIVTGLVGITEATLPYAFRDPVRVILSNVVGAAIGGALMMLFKVQNSGVSGVIALPLASNILHFTLSIVIGVAVATILLIATKKKVPESTSTSNEEDISFDLMKV